MGQAVVEAAVRRIYKNGKSRACSIEIPYSDDGLSYIYWESQKERKRKGNSECKKMWKEKMVVNICVGSWWKQKEKRPLLKFNVRKYHVFRVNICGATTFFSVTYISQKHIWISCYILRPYSFMFHYFIAFYI